jgi:Fibronectin type III domain
MIHVVDEKGSDYFECSTVTFFFRADTYCFKMTSRVISDTANTYGVDIPWTVTAVGANGTTNTSVISSFRTAPPPIQPATGLTVGATTPYGATLSWTASPPGTLPSNTVAQYKVMLNGVPNTPNPPTATTIVLLDPEAITPGTTYTWTVVALDVSGAHSATSVVGPPFTTPTPRMSLDATVSSGMTLNANMTCTVPVTLTVTWIPPIDTTSVKGYRLQCSPAGAAQWSSVDTVAPVTTATVTVALTTETKYDLRVATLDAAGVASGTYLNGATPWTVKVPQQYVTPMYNYMLMGSNACIPMISNPSKTDYGLLVQVERKELDRNAAIAREATNVNGMGLVVENTPLNITTEFVSAGKRNLCILRRNTSSIPYTAAFGSDFQLQMGQWATSRSATPDPGQFKIFTGPEVFFGSTPFDTWKLQTDSGDLARGIPSNTTFFSGLTRVGSIRCNTALPFRLVDGDAVVILYDSTDPLNPSSYLRSYVLNIMFSPKKWKMWNM